MPLCSLVHLVRVWAAEARAIATTRMEADRLAEKAMLAAAAADLKARCVHVQVDRWHGTCDARGCDDVWHVIVTVCVVCFSLSLLFTSV